jgi:erythromycin esterase
MKKPAIMVLTIGISLISCESKTEKWNDWIQKHSYGINLSDTINYQDLNFLKDKLKEKRIVFLGESGHGVAEYTKLKSRIIHYLHEELDFYVLAFESSSAEAFAADFLAPTQTLIARSAIPSVPYGM